MTIRQVKYPVTWCLEQVSNSCTRVSTGRAYAQQLLKRWSDTLFSARVFIDFFRDFCRDCCPHALTSVLRSWCKIIVVYMSIRIQVPRGTFIIVVQQEPSAKLESASSTPLVLVVLCDERRTQGNILRLFFMHDFSSSPRQVSESALYVLSCCLPCSLHLTST